MDEAFRFLNQSKNASLSNAAENNTIVKKKIYKVI